MQALSFLLTYFLALGPFFCSTAPQAFFRPDRRFPTPSRAEAVKAGRRSAMAAHSVVSRPRLDSFGHGGRLDGLGPEERSVVECGPPIFRLRGLLSLPGPPFSTRSRGRWPHHGLRGSTPLCPERTQQEVDARRIARSSRPVPAGTAIRRERGEGIFRSTSGDGRRSSSVPLERCACGPHAMQDDGKLAGNRHRCLLKTDAFAKGLAPGLQRVWSR